MSAISNHDESTGGAVDPISAALIIGDKTDVRRSRVREKPKACLLYTSMPSALLVPWGARQEHPAPRRVYSRQRAPAVHQ